MLKNRSFYLFRRGNGYFYGRLLTPEGRITATKSTGERDRDSALLVVADWVKNGIPVARRSDKSNNVRYSPNVVYDLEMILKSIKQADIDRAGAMKIVSALKQKGLVNFNFCEGNAGNENFLDFIREFWDYDNSHYVKDKLTHGHSITRGYIKKMAGRIRYFVSVFEGRTLASITRQDLKNFSVALCDNYPTLRGGTINEIMKAALIPLTYAFREGLIPNNVSSNFDFFKKETRTRGILTQAEAAVLFYRNWEDKRSYAGNLLAATTGLRAGEVLAIKKQDIQDGILCVNNSLSRTDGLKTPKNGHERKVPLLPQVKKLLLSISTNSEFIFGGKMNEHFLIEGLYSELDAMGIDRRGRNICFHSWRHFYASNITDKIEMGKAKKITGHLSGAMLEHYSAHITESAINDAF